MYTGFKKYTEYTRDQVRHLLSTDPKWIEISIVRLYRQRQTTREQEDQQTITNNERGFQQMDARFFSGIAEWIESQAAKGVPCGERITPRQMVFVKKPWGKNRIPRVAKYARQVLEMIEDKARREAGV